MTVKQTVSVALTEKNLNQFLSDSEFAVVEFSAEWCLPCRAMEEAIAEIAPQYRSNIAFGQVDVDTEEALADRFDVESVPHLVLFKMGQVAEVRQGFLGIEKLQNDLERLIEGTPKDLTYLFADGDLWDLDDDLSKDILGDIDRAVLLFLGSKPKRRVARTKMASFAKKYRKMVFFASLDSRRCPQTRHIFVISRELVTVVFLHRQKVMSRIVGKASDREYRAHIELLLEASL